MPEVQLHGRLHVLRQLYLAGEGILILTALYTNTACVSGAHVHTGSSNVIFACWILVLIVVAAACSRRAPPNLSQSWNTTPLESSPPTAARGRWLFCRHAPLKPNQQHLLFNCSLMMDSGRKARVSHFESFRVFSSEITARTRARGVSSGSREFIFSVSCSHDFGTLTMLRDTR